MRKSSKMLISVSTLSLIAISISIAYLIYNTTKRRVKVVYTKLEQILNKVDSFLEQNKDQPGFEVLRNVYEEVSKQYKSYDQKSVDEKSAYLEKTLSDAFEALRKILDDVSKLNDAKNENDSLVKTIQEYIEQVFGNKLPQSWQELKKQIADDLDSINKAYKNKDIDTILKYAQSLEQKFNQLKDDYSLAQTNNLKEQNQSLFKTASQLVLDLKLQNDPIQKTITSNFFAADDNDKTIQAKNDNLSAIITSLQKRKEEYLQVNKANEEQLNRALDIKTKLDESNNVLNENLKDKITDAINANNEIYPKLTNNESRWNEVKKLQKTNDEVEHDFFYNKYQLASKKANEIYAYLAQQEGANDLAPKAKELIDNNIQTKDSSNTDLQNSSYSLTKISSELEYWYQRRLIKSKNQYYETLLQAEKLKNFLVSAMPNESTDELKSLIQELTKAIKDNDNLISQDSKQYDLRVQNLTQNMNSIKQRMNNLTDVAHKWYEQQHNVVSQLLTTLTNEKLKNYLTQRLQENSNLKDQELKTYANAAANLENACNKVLSYQEFEKEKTEIDTWLEQNPNISDEYKTQITDKKTQAQTNIDNLLDENNKNSQAMSDVVSSLENYFNHIRLNAKKDEVSQFQTQNNQALETLNSKLEEAKVRQQLVSEINTKIQEIEDKILQSKILDNEANQTEININNFLKIAVNSISKAQLQDKSNEAQDWIAKNSQAIGNDRLETLKNIIDDVNQTINQNPDLNFDNLKDKLVLIFNKTKVAKSVSDLSNLFKNNQNLLPTLTDNSLEKSVVTAVNDNITESLKIANELLNGNKVTDKDETKLANAFSDYQSIIQTETQRSLTRQKYTEANDFYNDSSTTSELAKNILQPTLATSLGVIDSKNSSFNQLKQLATSLANKLGLAKEVEKYFDKKTEINNDFLSKYTDTKPGYVTDLEAKIQDHDQTVLSQANDNGNKDIVSQTLKQLGLDYQTALDEKDNEDLQLDVSKAKTWALANTYLYAYPHYLNLTNNIAQIEAKTKEQVKQEYPTLKSGLANTFALAQVTKALVDTTDTWNKYKQNNDVSDLHGILANVEQDIQDVKQKIASYNTSTQYQDVKDAIVKMVADDYVIKFSNISSELYQITSWNIFDMWRSAEDSEYFEKRGWYHMFIIGKIDTNYKKIEQAYNEQDLDAIKQAYNKTASWTKIVNYADDDNRNEYPELYRNISNLVVEHYNEIKNEDLKQFKSLELFLDFFDLNSSYPNWEQNKEEIVSKLKNKYALIKKALFEDYKCINYSDYLAEDRKDDPNEAIETLKKCLFYTFILLHTDKDGTVITRIKHLASSYENLINSLQQDNVNDSLLNELRQNSDFNQSISSLQNYSSMDNSDFIKTGREDEIKANHQEVAELYAKHEELGWWIEWQLREYYEDGNGYMTNKSKNAYDFIQAIISTQNKINLVIENLYNKKVSKIKQKAQQIENKLSSKYFDILQKLDEAQNYYDQASVKQENLDDNSYSQTYDSLQKANKAFNILDSLINSLSTEN
ncbi:hypothetical protein ACWXVT_02275 [Mycoplasma sp. 1573]